MTTLHLGVTDIPYAYDQQTQVRDAKGKLRRGKSREVVKSITTGEVAEILEDKYHLMELFFEENADAIVANIEDSLKGAIENLALGGVAQDPYGDGTQKIDEAFKKFITEGAVERLGIPGTPTQAALDGVSHRKAHPYAKKNKRRQSFVDTGLYVANFISWID